MSDPRLLRIPDQFRNPAEVLATAAQIDLPNVVLLSMDDAGLLIMNAGNDVPLTEAQIIWLLEKAKQMILNRAWHA